MNKGLEETKCAFEKHFNNLKHYGKIECINLLDKECEQSLSNNYCKLLKEYGIRCIHNDKVEFDYSEFKGNYICKQKRVPRINCFDNLDRTNIMQKKLAVKFISKFSDKTPEVEKMWMCHGDAISDMYAGTAALSKNNSMYGIVHDMYKSARRFYNSIFIDDIKQSNIDILVSNK